MQNLNSPNFPRNYATRGFHEPISITTLLIGAAVGAVSAAVTGGNILKGALLGAIGSGIVGAFAGAAAGAVPGAVDAASIGLVDSAVSTAAAAVPEAAGSAFADAAVGEMATQSFGESAAGMLSEGGLSPTLNAAATPAVSGAEVATLPTQTVAPYTPDTAVAQTTANTELMPANTNTAAGGVPSNTSLRPYEPFESDFSASNVLTPAKSSSGSFLDDFLKQGRENIGGMMKSKLVADVAGQMVKGYAGGKNQEAQLTARRQEIDRARANARFGNFDSRYANNGMMNANLTYKG